MAEMIDLKRDIERVILVGVSTSDHDDTLFHKYFHTSYFRIAGMFIVDSISSHKTLNTYTGW